MHHCNTIQERNERLDFSICFSIFCFVRRQGTYQRFVDWFACCVPENRHDSLCLKRTFTRWRRLWQRKNDTHEVEHNNNCFLCLSITRKIKVLSTFLCVIRVSAARELFVDRTDERFPRILWILWMKIECECMSVSVCARALPTWKSSSGPWICRPWNCCR